MDDSGSAKNASCAPTRAGLQRAAAEIAALRATAVGSGNVLGQTKSTVVAGAAAVASAEEAAHVAGEVRRVRRHQRRHRQLVGREVYRRLARSRCREAVTSRTRTLPRAF